MDLKKDILVSKFLLPISVVMMAAGFILLFLGFFPILNFGSNFDGNVGYIMSSLLFGGFVLFIVGLVDRSITIKRNRSNIEQQGIPPLSTNSLWIKVGIIIIISTICIMAYVFVGLSGMSD